MNEGSMSVMDLRRSEALDAGLPAPGSSTPNLLEVRGLKKHSPIHGGLFGCVKGQVGAVDAASLFGLALVACGPRVPATPASQLERDAEDSLVVIPQGTAAAQLRGEGGVPIPPVIDLVAGAAVVVRNEDSAMHSFFTMPIAPGQTVRKEFPMAGQFGHTSMLSCSIAGAESVTVRVRPA